MNRKLTFRPRMNVRQLYRQLYRWGWVGIGTGRNGVGSRRQRPPGSRPHFDPFHEYMYSRVFRRYSACIRVYSRVFLEYMYSRVFSLYCNVYSYVF